MRQIVFVLLLSSALLAQSSSGQRGAGNQQSNPAVGGPAQSSIQQPTAPANDELARMRDDLNKLESLNMNMSSEIEFLRDQNLQILLRTNSQMWTILIRDMRQQIEREEQRRAAPQAQPARPEAKPSPR
ncbi:MAG: hypothetical protein ABSD98_09635 [Candidatus Korobacteraceae bacterium]|jgi:hypothetical protein